MKNRKWPVVFRKAYKVLGYVIDYIAPISYSFAICTASAFSKTRNSSQRKALVQIVLNKLHLCYFMLKQLCFTQVLYHDGNDVSG